MLTIRRTVEYYIRNVRGKAYACFHISIDEASAVETPPVGKSSISIGVSHHDTQSPHLKRDCEELIMTMNEKQF